MKKLSLILLCLIFFTFSCTKKQEEQKQPDILPDVPEGAQAVSLLGDPLYASTPSEDTLTKYEAAKGVYEADPDKAENIIWYGRRTAYKGDYREAIRIYTEGIQKFPDDARFYRHRGHRYISIREFERAVQDFEQAVTLIKGTEDIVEPDGQPNAQNIPVSTLHTNIWYHLGLAYYLKNDLENALRVYREGVKASANDDMLTAMTHWLYMTLRLLNRDQEAKAALEPIHPDMNVIENTVYHKLCLLYKEEIPLEDLTGEQASDVMSDAMAYGIGNWYFYNGQIDKAEEIFKKIVDNKVWNSFGHIAAEADFVRRFR